MFGSNRHLKACHPRGGRCGGMGSMASRAVIERFLLLCPASHRFLSHPHASAGMTWEAETWCFSVVTGLWSHVIQALGSNRHLELCRSGGVHRSFTTPYSFALSVTSSVDKRLGLNKINRIPTTSRPPLIPIHLNWMQK